jgi:mono/diheme cytochrome c family protein
MAESTFGVLGIFKSGADLLKAVPKVKEKGFASLEAYTPYPVHGIDKAIGIKKSKLGILVFIMGTIGAVSAFLFQWWTSAVSYPLRIGGKPYNSWEAWVPAMFEVTVLFATFTAGLGMLFIFNKLPFFGSPILKSKAIAATTRDRFALLIQPTGGLLDVEAARAALLEAGGTDIEILPAPDLTPPGPGWWARNLAGIALVCVAVGFGTMWAIKIFPTVKPMVEMENQAKLDAQKADGFFKDGHGMQLPPVGTVPRHYMPILAKSPDQAGKDLVNPLPVTAKVLQRGKAGYDIHCAVCHGYMGRGKPLLDKFYKASPANLQSSTVMNAPDGYIYFVISKGKGSMPSYEADISSKDRWAIIHYVRALQRSLHAKEEDLK